MAEMRFEPKLKMIPTQRQELRLKQVPRLIQTAELLQKSALELERFIRTELIENPFLEVGEIQASEDTGLHNEDSISAIEEGRVGKEFARLEELSDYFERLGDERQSLARGEEEDSRQELLRTATQPKTLHDYLLEQLRFLDLDNDVRRTAEHIIYCINDEGYLLSSLDEIVSECDVSPRVAEEALSVVQSLEPPGIGARNIVECLLLQVRDEERFELERRIIKDHLEDVLRNRLPKIVKETGESIERVKEAIEFIRHLHPHPGTLVGGEGAPPVRIDVVIQRLNGDYEVIVEDANIPPIRLSPVSKELLNAARDNDDVRRYLLRRYERAQHLIRDIELRRMRLRMIVEEVVREQYDFLEHGIEYLRPLTMREIARRLGLHTSTVSRAIANKYVQTPQGVFPLKFFFTATSLKQAGGSEVSSSSVKERIRRLISKEDPHNPLSDDEIAKMLKKEGFRVARRTVAKYRRMLDIPSSRQRRKY